MTDFDQLWKWSESRGKFQQEYSELNHIFDLMKACDCQSYLEVGCAEGNSLYILGHASHEVSYIDIDEDHTREKRNGAITKLGKPVNKYHGDSRKHLTMPFDYMYDCVLIDGGHDYDTVLSDSVMYGKRAKKYIFWHDIQLPEVKRAIEAYVDEYKPGKLMTFINSDTFGYGVIEVGKND